MFSNSYFSLWTKAFGLSQIELGKGTFSIVTSGYYVDTHQDSYVFIYFDEHNGKLILACSEGNLQLLKQELGDTLQSLSYESVRSLAWFKDKVLTFKDVDFCFSNKSEFRPSETVGLDIRQLTPANESEINEFYLDCSENDKDTLDLTFQDEIAFGVYKENRLIGISRYAVLRNTQIADITVAIGLSHRGQGYSNGLVSHLIETALKNDLIPKYRVDETNLASIAIAKKLGFTPRFHLLAWDTAKT